MQAPGSPQLATPARISAGARRRKADMSRQTSAHVRADWLTAEVRQRAALPKWLTEALDQARRSGTDAQLPVVVLHAAGRQARVEDSLVVMRLRDFVAWHGALPAGCCSEREQQETDDIPL